MSSTGRGAERSPGDFYRTPSWCVKAIAAHLGPLGPFDMIVDPGCGDGAIRAGLIGLGWASVCGRHIGIETHPKLANTARESKLYDEVIEADYVRWCEELNGELAEYPRRLVIGNPPYSKALEFVEASLAIADTVVMLLRLAWISSQRRREFHQANPSDLYVLTKRPSFNGKGTDSCDYAWFVWNKRGPSGRGVVL